MTLWRVDDALTWSNSPGEKIGNKERRLEIRKEEWGLGFGELSVVDCGRGYVFQIASAVIGP
jgi:hypothetical protein